MDISEPAIRVAAFSLYLAALELDPNPRPAKSLKFQPLIGKTLLVGDARTIEQQGDGNVALTTPAGPKQFDLIVGNPPWSFKGQSGTEARRKLRAAGVPAQPRGEGLDFILRAAEFSHEKTRFGVILSATPFLVAAAQAWLQSNTLCASWRLSHSSTCPICAVGFLQPRRCLRWSYLLAIDQCCDRTR